MVKEYFRDGCPPYLESTAEQLASDSSTDTEKVLDEEGRLAEHMDAEADVAAG